jgi:hypothetical protein
MGYGRPAPPRSYTVESSEQSRAQILEFERVWWPRAAEFVRGDLDGVRRALGAVAAGTTHGGCSWNAIDPWSGAFCLQDWQLAAIPAGSPAARLFSLDAAQGGARSIQGDDRRLLRGSLYYPGLARSRGVLEVEVLGGCYLRGCEELVVDAHRFLDALRPDDVAAVALLGGTVDNVRGIALNLLAAFGHEPTSLVDLAGEMLLATVAWVVDLFEGASDLVDLRTRAGSIVELAERVLRQTRGEAAVEWLDRSDTWAWRREADDALTCWLSTRLALADEPRLLDQVTIVYGVARSGIELAHMVAEVARRTAGVELPVGILGSAGDIWAGPAPAVGPARVRCLVCDDSSATGATLEACAHALGMMSTEVVGVLLANGPEPGRGVSGTGPLTDPALYGSHVVGMARRAPLERRRQLGPGAPDEPLVRDKQKERLAGYLCRAGRTTLHAGCAGSKS